MRRALLLVALAALSTTTPAQDKALSLNLVGEGVIGATCVTTPPGEVDRIFVTSDATGVWLIENGVLLPEPFLDLTPLLSSSRGLVSMAFHPDYANNGRLFLAYYDANDLNHLVEYQVSPSDPNRADPSSATPVIDPIPFQSPDHTIDHLLFGPDGMLYVSVGDGVAVNDMGPNPAQDLRYLTGKLLRLDVDAPYPHVPADNPFVAIANARPEIFSFGLRQPWRFAFDEATDRLWIADVGRANLEELNVTLRSAAAGASFGWRCQEGSQCNQHSTCLQPCYSWVEPVYEYPHDGGRCAIIGGEVYRGTQFPELAGSFLFTDWCATSLKAASLGPQGKVSIKDLSGRVTTSDGVDLMAISSFGRDGNGELLVLSRAGGKVYRLEKTSGLEGGCSSSELCAATANSVGPGARMGALGTASISGNAMAIEVTGLPPDQPGLLFYSSTPRSHPFGNGILCLGGGGAPLHRLTAPATADASGRLLQPLDFQAAPMGSGPGQVTAGSTWHMQLWYRDPAAGDFDLSSALTVEFCP